MKVRLLSCAEQELADAVDYYNVQCPGLGFEFAAEIKSTLNRILAFPEAWPPLSSRTRRCLTDRFPYGVLYQVRKEHIIDNCCHASETRSYEMAGSDGENLNLAAAGLFCLAGRMVKLVA